MNVIFEIENLLIDGEYSFAEIAKMFNISVGDIETIQEQMIENELEDSMDDSMDGDFDSAMTSAGFGTDEDYGYYGDEY